jgi:hypothetical protein
VRCERFRGIQQRGQVGHDSQRREGEATRQSPVTIYVQCSQPLLECLTMRQLVSYDDITLCREEQIIGPQDLSSSSRPKKRKRSNQKLRHARQHWDEPSAEETLDHDEENIDVFPGESEVVGTGPSEQQEEVGECERELTYEDVWDDSALIVAWDAATEEYEVFTFTVHAFAHYSTQPFRLITVQASSGRKILSTNPLCAYRIH